MTPFMPEYVKAEMDRRLAAADARRHPRLAGRRTRFGSRLPLVGTRDR